MKFLQRLQNKKILILGFGREGMSTFRYVRKKFPRTELGIADAQTLSTFSQSVQSQLRQDKRLNIFFGKDYLESLGQFDVCVKSAGVPPYIPELVLAEEQGKIITSHIELFFEACPGQIIGVTGTKGKSTTTSVIYQVLKAGGVRAHLAGNIGIPPLSLLEKKGVGKNDVFVLELSSYQLLLLKKSPHIAVVQNIVPEHLDYHKTFEKYVDAKRNIVRFQRRSDYVFYNASYNVPKSLAKLSPGKKIPFSSVFIEENGCFVDEGMIVYHKDGHQEKIMPVGYVPLRGEFNVENVLPAVLVGRFFKVRTSVIASAISEFQPLPHRLELVGQKSGVTFYNDSLSTIPEAAIAAIQSFHQTPIILIAGGFDRSQDFHELGRQILQHRLKALVLFPVTGKRLWQDLQQVAKPADQLPTHVFVQDMHAAVSKAYALAQEGDTVLLSPASPSFGIFRDYEDRGEQFRLEVGKLKGK